MYDSINKLNNSSPEGMKGLKHTAAPEFLFLTDDQVSIKLSKERSDLFIKITAQILCVVG